ncbi:hypothetical protein FTUN_5661 [Frigoriglobus tundricola]|uniref:Uncharacterized protein n=1 Tax=Frigoriglobus tundricola TaxID=2774151 RepID=A0A6M5YXX7_9BACT|nr:hypothetical protein FTUN_5661 [Frigoriglobus tundricola]
MTLAHEHHYRTSRFTFLLLTPVSAFELGEIEPAAFFTF